MLKVPKDFEKQMPFRFKKMPQFYREFEKSAKLIVILKERMPKVYRNILVYVKNGNFYFRENRIFIRK